MRKAPWVTCVWPGLPQLWTHGSWSALALAVAFTILLNGALVSSFVWTELISPALISAAWLGVACVWIVSAAVSAWQLAAGVHGGEPEGRDDPFVAARDEYLKGKWLEAEVLLDGVLRRNPGDVDAQLLLATMLRRSGRREEAYRRLRELKRLDGAEKWNNEIHHELERLRRPAQAAAVTHGE